MDGAKLRADVAAGLWPLLTEFTYGELRAGRCRCWIGSGVVLGVS